MKTNDLVTMLATGADPVATDAAARRLAIAIVLGAVSAGLLMDFLLGVRHDLDHAVAQPMFWVKSGYVLSLAAAGLLAVARLARPGFRLTGVVFAVALPVLLIWILGVFALTGATPAERELLLFGYSWTYCPILIATLSLPTFVAVIWAVKGLAPTRLRLAGAAAGLVAGAMGAVVYSLHCTEMGAPFLGSWYLLGVLTPTIIGTLIGPRLLRW